ncbi:MAG: hypothetical protein KY433_08290 [Actinobacteria bacterium]|nr:hypothetical protein [Actinomycetota bacterium]
MLLRHTGDSLPGHAGARLRLVVVTTNAAGTAVAASAGTGVAYAALPASEAGALPALRTALAPYDGTAVVLQAPDPVRASLDHWGPVGDALDLMRRVKERFDPERRMSPGRFVGGL